MAEASELGLAPGSWPETLATDIGNKMPLIRISKKVDAEGDLLYVRYLQSNGIILVKIFND